MISAANDNTYNLGWIFWWLAGKGGRKLLEWGTRVAGVWYSSDSSTHIQGKEVTLEELVPCFKWAQTHRRSGHSFWTLNHAGLLVKGRRLVLSRTSWVEMPRTTEDSDSWTKKQIWQFGSVQSGAFRLAKSEGRLAVPARCWRLTWYLLTMVKKEVTRRLAENSPRQNFWRAWTQGWLSVRTQARCLDWIMKGLKCFTAAAINSASTSHGYMVTWCLRSLELKKPARRRRSWRVTYKVAPRPRWVTEPSVTIQSWSEARGRTIDWCVWRASCAVVNFSRRLSSHWTWSWDCRLTKDDLSGSTSWEQWGGHG